MAKTQIDNIVKPIFEITVFKTKRYLPLDEYTEHLAKKAIECELLTADEYKMFSTKLKKAKLSPEVAVQCFENIVKSRWSERDKENYFKQINKLSNEKGSFFDGLLKLKAKKQSKK